MAKQTKSKTKAEVRTLRAQQILFLIISVIIILTMVLSLTMNY